MAAKKSPPDSIDSAQALALLTNAARPAHRAGLARYGIHDTHALGVPMRDIQALGKRIGRQPALAQPLWDSGIYEARLLVAFVAASVAPATERQGQYLVDLLKPAAAKLQQLLGES